MFKNFDPKKDISSATPVKSSVQRQIRSRLLENFPRLGLLTGLTDDHGEGITVLDHLWPKKQGLVQHRCHDHLALLSLNGQVLFFQARVAPGEKGEEIWCPVLRVVQQYPSIMPHIRMDRGALKFLLGGANLMCRGLTSAGGRLPPAEDGLVEPFTKKGLEAGTVVAIDAEGKRHACGIGRLVLSTEEIQKVNSGIGVEMWVTIGDGLWDVDSLV